MLSYSAPTFWPVTLSEVKNRLRIDHTDWDADIAGTWIPAATFYVETETGRSLVSRAHVLTLRGFPTSGLQMIKLQRGKAQSIESIQYVLGGTTYTLTGPSSGSPAGTDYQENLASDEYGLVMPNQGAFWPSWDTDVPAPVTVNYTAGWLRTEMPADVKDAVTQHVGDLIHGAAPSQAVRSLASGWRIGRV